MKEINSMEIDSKETYVRVMTKDQYDIEQLKKCILALTENVLIKDSHIVDILDEWREELEI